jgi:hypothetical protein
MDIIYILILMAVFYILPEILKKRQPKQYEYPQIPDRVLPPELKPSRDVKPPPGSKVKPVSIASKAEEPPVLAQATSEPEALKVAVPLMSEGSAWQDKLDQTVVLNGVIFAEILQPPRAHRPFRPSRKPGR